jgi:hypothetical protein
MVDDITYVVPRDYSWIVASRNRRVIERGEYNRADGRLL